MEPSVSQHFCLRWNNYRTHLTTVFDQLLRHELFVDVTLAVDGHCQIKAHKVILSACSPFFRSVLSESQCDHPLIIIRGVTGSEMLALVQFMYRGEISVAQEQLPALLKVAEMLKVRGLTEVADDDDDDDDDNVVEDDDEVEEEKGIGGGGLSRSCGDNRAAAVVTHLCETDSAAAAKDGCDETRRFVSPESLVPETSLDYPMSNSSDVPRPDSASSGNAPDSSPSSPGQAATVIAITSVPSVTVSRTSLNSRPSVSVIRVRSPLAHSPPLCMSTDEVEPFRSLPSHPRPSTVAASAAAAAPAASAAAAAAAALERSQGGPVETAQQRFIKSVSRQLTDEVEIRPAIAEMIKEEERAKMLERAASWTRSPETSFQHQLQRAWQKSWNQHQGIMQNVRFRERGPLKTWRPETMAEAILCVLREGQSLSQAARKFDIPYPTFVLYANRVHNMLGPSLDNSGELRPKGRGRPQRILLGNWPDVTVHSVIRAVVFRDTRALKQHMTHGSSSSGGSSSSRAQQQQPPPLRALSASGHLAPTAQRPTVPHHAPVTSHYPFPMLPLAAAAAHHSTPPLSAATAAAAAAAAAGNAGAAAAAAAAGNHANLLGLHNLHMMMGLLAPTAMLPPSAGHMSAATHTGDTASRIRLPSIVNLSNHFPTSDSGSGSGVSHSASATMTAAPSLLSTTSATHQLSLSLSRALSSRTLTDTYSSPAPTTTTTTTETAEAAAGMSHNIANGSLNYQLSHAMNATDLSRATATANTAAAAAAATMVSCDPELIDLTERTTATLTTATCRQPAETLDFLRHWTSDAAFSGAISAAPSSGDLANHNYNHRQQHQYSRQDCQSVMSHNLTVASSNQMADYDDDDEDDDDDDDDDDDGDQTTDGAPLALAETVLSFDDNMEPDNNNDNVSDAGGGGGGGGVGGGGNVQTIAANSCAVSGDSFSLAAGQPALPDIRAISSVHLATLQASP